MPLETVRFDRVFGVVHTSQNRRLVTLFGFESAGRKEYSVAVPGTPRVESGMTVTAYFEEADNWQTLIGWRDHETGEIVCVPDAEPLFMCVWSFGVLCVTVRGVWYGSALLSVIAAFAVGVFAWGVRRFSLQQRVRRELDASGSIGSQ